MKKTTTKATTSKKKLTGSDGIPLLTYLPSTEPPLIQVGVSGRIDIAAIVGSPTESIYCSQIVLYVPVGTDAASLYLTTPAPTGSTNRTDWTAPSAVIKPGSELGLDINENYATFTYDNRNQTSTLINYSLVLGVNGMVNQLTGDFVVHVSETSGTDPAHLSKRSGQLTLTKHTPQFYLQNFVATVATAPLQPVTEFANGAAITLSWDSNGKFFQIFEKGNPTPIYSNNRTTFTLPTGVATDTTFFLVAMMTAGPGAQPPAGFQPIYLYDSLTITITNPDLTPKTVSVAGNTSIGGTLGVAGNTTLSTLTASGTTTVGTPSANANLNVNGALSVGGTTTLAATSTGDIAAGNISAKGVTTQSNIYAGSDVVVTGHVNGAKNVIAGDYLVASGVSTNGGSNLSRYSKFYTGNTNALWATNNSGNYPTIYCQNNGGGPTTGPTDDAQGQNGFGISTNARIASESGHALFTHLPTSKGHRVVTSPLSLEIEIQFSGEAKLSKGRSNIKFNKEITEIISHSQSYRVLLTPTGKCLGLCVTEKGRTGFTVEECGDKPNNVTFDWLVIARKPRSLEMNAADEMPAKLPKQPPRSKGDPAR